MSEAWNLTPNEWSKVLQSDSAADQIAKDLKSGWKLPWAEVLLKYAADSKRTLDLGCGKGELSATLALDGKTTTLLDWSPTNLEFCRKLYSSLGLKGSFQQADMTKTLPFPDASFDTVFSCGVFEYFSDEQIVQILKETLRVTKDRVIIMAPNACSLPYRIGKRYMEKKKTWEWGGERPFRSLKKYFRKAGLRTLAEFSVGTKHSLDFLNAMPRGEKMKKAITKIFRLRDHAKPSFLSQGYLLITVGEKPKEAGRANG